MKLHLARCWLIFLALGALPSAGFAHSVGRSALALRFEGGEGLASWRMTALDLDGLLGFDADHDRSVSPDELAQASRMIAAHLLGRIELDADGTSCQTEAGPTTLDGAYLQFDFRVRCPSALRVLQLRYDLFFDHDPGHTAQVTLTGGGGTSLRVPTASARRIELAIGTDTTWQRAREYLWQGVVHIWNGYDHVLFLLTLLVPAVLVRGRARWVPAPRFGVALREVVKIVSAFTLAHSITLSLASLGVMQLPSRWVEATIAASVCLAALNNSYGWVTRRLWLGACAFGLIHGFGFASVLDELGLPAELLLVALIAFNAGVELGQLVIVLMFLPLAFAARGSRWYEWLGLRAGSLAIVVIGLVWLLERVLDLSLEQAASVLGKASLVQLWPLGFGVALAIGLGWSWRVRYASWARRVAWLSAIASVGYVVHVAQTERTDLKRELGLQLEAARASLSRREWVRTQTLLERANRLATTLGDERAQAVVLDRTGSLHIARADLESARVAHQRAFALSESVGDELGCATAQRAIGLVAHLAGDTTRAARAYRRALALHERLGLDAQAARDATELAALYWRSKQFTEARAMAERAHEFTQRAPELTTHTSNLPAR